MSYVSQLISKSISPLDVANKYGLKVNRSGRAQCPLHGGEDYNFKVSNEKGGRCYCFVCNKSVDSIGLAKALMQKEYPDTIRILDQDFGLGIVGSKDAETVWMKHKAKDLVAMYREKESLMGGFYEV
ncbi:MAG: hypothetical protein EOL98_13285 [Negativicutes bacterium]|nr:hypothetical protein [Negativicutes bacterium]